MELGAGRERVEYEVAQAHRITTRDGVEEDDVMVPDGSSDLEREKNEYVGVGVGASSAV